MTFPFNQNDLVVGAIVLGLVGIIECFVGYRFFRLLLALLGFVVGAAIAVSLFNSDQTIVVLLVALVGGLIGATLFYFLYFIGTFLAGIFLGVTLSTMLASALNLTSNNTTILVIIGAVIGGFLGFALAKYIIMLSTAVTGAAQIVYAALLLLPSIRLIQSANQVQVSLNPQQSIIVSVVTLILAAFGFVAQYNMNCRTVAVVPPTSTV